MGGRRFKQKGELQKAEWAKSFNQLVTALTQHPLTPIWKLTYQKSPENIKVDSTMLQVFVERTENIRRTLLQPAQDEVAVQERFLKDKRQASTALQEKLLDSKEKIRKMSAPGKEVVEQKEVNGASGCCGFSNSEGTYHLTCKVDMDKVETETTPLQDFPNGRIVKTDVTYDAKRQCTNWTVVCDGGGELGYHFKLCMLVDRQHHNKAAIEAVERQIERDEYDLKEMKDKIEKGDRKRDKSEYEVGA